MAAPQGFSWVEKPLLAALARPAGPEDFTWLRENGIEVLLSLTEDRPRRDWADAANMLVFHEPLEDMEAPSQEQLDRCVSAILRATERHMGVAVHCGAGLGRTGVVLAAYFVARGLSAANAVARVRRLRPGSVETDEQAEAVELFARRKRSEGG
ncbi:MAG TPA: dual specificity protein phosphatase family protein [Gemmataceae bacterium]|jgi:atypical dual specificity phosphatase|nr:dual specificity protein phosphatase family protein [Gemmataceae bacterium]